MFSLDGFESHISAQIQARGLAYFENRAVERLEETEKGRVHPHLAASLILKYPRRPAMREELGKVLK